MNHLSAARPAGQSYGQPGGRAGGKWVVAGKKGPAPPREEVLFAMERVRAGESGGRAAGEGAGPRDEMRGELRFELGHTGSG